MAQGPDILWIVTTQWRAQACGYAGDTNARTRQLDRLAEASVDYAHAVTPHPFGPFARAALLTGVASPHNGVRDYFDPLPADARTIAHELNELGYATAFFGKWHLGRRARDAALVGEAHAQTIVPPHMRGGFGFWEGFESGFLLNDPWLHGTRLPEPQPFSGYQSDVVCERAAAWLAGNNPGRKSTTEGHRPWFCVVSLEAPHPPYEAPAAGIARRDPGEIALRANVPRGGETEARARRELAGYSAHLEATDRAIGRLLAQVDAAIAGRGRRAPVVVFTSVHGDMHGAHGLFRKGWPHEESVRVPLLVRGADPGARTSDAAVSLLDLPKWTRDWARGERAVTDRSESAISMPSVVALPHQCDRVWRGVRTKTRKLVLNGDGSPWLFFDLETDPLERRNLVSEPAWREEIDALRRRVG
jgi:arylsulfatase A-like enzyme